MLFLESEDPEKDIHLYINSPGGDITALLAIYDTMKYIKPDVSTFCFGQAASAGAVLLGGGHQGQALRAAALADHAAPALGRRRRARPPTSRSRPGRSCGCATCLNEMLAKDTGQEIERIAKDTDRDFVMTADEAVAYGLVDEVIASREGTALAAVGAA